ncbi:MAG: RDD family protein [Proteobacteria bacterium]|nr:RDD family protein [Pseudomonadota bacterium]
MPLNNPLTPLTTPPLKRRLASMLYESLLLFGVVFFAAWIFSTLLQQRHALYLKHGLQAWLFLVLGLYFVYFWRRSGQTLAMKTWRIKLVSANGGPVSLGRAIARYLLCWMWFLPALALDAAWGLKTWASIGLPLLGMALWAATILLDKNRQFLHDRLAGTRLVTYHLPVPTTPATPAKSAD